MFIRVCVDVEEISFVNLEMKENVVETADAVLQASMPCMFTDEELDQVVEEAEKEGCALRGEVKRMFAKWRK